MAAVRTLVLLGCVAAAFAEESSWDGLRARWSIRGAADQQQNTAFFDLPKTVSDAESEGWVQTEDTDVTTYCLPDDPRVCLLYDANGIIAGIAIGVLVADVSALDVDYDYELDDTFVKVEPFGIPIYRSRAYWVSEDVVREGRSSWKNGVGSGLWFEGKNGRVEVPIEQSQIESETLYSKEACIPAMGTHYYYNISAELDCSKFFPFFLLVDGVTGKLHGIGFQGYGTSSIHNRKWFEDIPVPAIKATVPDAPDCLPEWVQKVGISSLHVYLKDDVLGIVC